MTKYIATSAVSPIDIPPSLGGIFFLSKYPPHNSNPAEIIEQISANCVFASETLMPPDNSYIHKNGTSENKANCIIRDT